MLNIDKLRYDIYKKYEERFMGFLDGVYCYRGLENRIIWMVDNKMWMFQRNDKIYITILLWDSISDSHMAITGYKVYSRPYTITQTIIKEIIENNFKLGHLTPHFTNLISPPLIFIK